MLTEKSIVLARSEKASLQRLKRKCYLSCEILEERCRFFPFNIGKQILVLEVTVDTYATEIQTMFNKSVLFYIVLTIKIQPDKVYRIIALHDNWNLV